MQRRSRILAMLLEPQVDRRHRRSRVRHAIDDEPSAHSAAATTGAAPIEHALGDIRPRDIAVVTHLQLRQRKHWDEAAAPRHDLALRHSLDTELVSRSARLNGRVARSEEMRLTLTDEVARFALQIDIVAVGRRRARRRRPEIRRRRNLRRQGLAGVGSRPADQPA